MSRDNWKIQAKQHFANSRSPEKMVEIKVPEWGITVYYFPMRSLAEDRFIKMGIVAGASKQADGEQSLRIDSIGGQVSELIARARDAAGRNLFAQDEFEDILGGYDKFVVERVVGDMIDEAPPSEEEAKK